MFCFSRFNNQQRVDWILGAVAEDDEGAGSSLFGVKTKHIAARTAQRLCCGMTDRCSRGGPVLRRSIGPASPACGALRRIG
jgi:hypothetical protein